jgi:hypothetical protein
MVKEREGKEKSGMKVPAKNLKEKRAAKEAKREEKRAGSKSFVPSSPNGSGMQKAP